LQQRWKTTDRDNPQSQYTEKSATRLTSVALQLYSTCTATPPQLRKGTCKPSTAATLAAAYT
jgi:hypothetical protein